MELLAGGLKLMVFGMGTVFLFLCIMVVLVGLMSKALAPFKNALTPPAPAPKKAAAGSGDDAKLAAVAAVAVELFRNRK